MTEFRKIQGTLAEIEALEAVLADARSRVLSLEKPRDLAAQVYAARRARDACFGADAVLFGEPAWDILLELHSAQTTGRDTSITSACFASNVPNTTALRYLGNLEAHGLIVRRGDPGDRRRSVVSLSDTTSEMMQDWLARYGR
ncbi:MAG: winged helix DNA-binding protein [Sphingomonas sp.]|nr:winged helix DNA-binding protein [Sphingomonas sp.]